MKRIIRYFARHTQLLIVVILISAFLTRLIALNQSLWLDETITANVVRTKSFLGIITGFSIHDFHPPLFYFTEKVWTSLFGYSEISLRMPSVLFSLVVGYFVCKLGTLMKSKNAGILAMVLFLFNPLIFYYSQEARMYMMVTTSLVIATYYMVKIMKSNKPIITDTLLFNLCVQISIFTFYGSALYICILFLILAKNRQWKTLIITLITSTISLLILSPLVYLQLIHSQSALLDIKNWSLVLGKSEFKSFILVFVKFTTGRISGFAKIPLFAFEALGTAIFWYTVYRGARRSALLSAIVVTPIALGFIISFVIPMFQYFRFLYLLPIVCLLIAFSYDNTSILSKLFVIVTVIVIFSCTSLYLFVPSLHREDWRSVVQLVNSNSYLVYGVASVIDPLQYYHSDQLVHSFQSISAERSSTIVVLPYLSDVYGIAYQDLLKSAGYEKGETRYFTGPIVLEWWKKPALP